MFSLEYRYRYTYVNIYLVHSPIQDYKVECTNHDIYSRAIKAKER